MKKYEKYEKYEKKEKKKGDLEKNSCV